MRTAEKGALLLALATAYCGGGDTVEVIDPTESNIVVNVTNVPARTAKLSLKATLGGQPSTSMPELTTDFTRFGFSVPYSLSGRLALDATAKDSDGCIHGTGQGQTDLPNALVEVPLPLAPQSPRKCEPLTPCAAGSICGEAVRPTSNILYGAYAISPTDIWAVGDNGAALHYDGISWKSVPVPPAYNGYYLNAVWAAAPNDIWAVGEVGLILHGNGTTWTLYDDPNIMYDLNGIWGWSANNIMTCGSQAYCWRWNGSTWANVSPAGTTKMFGVWGSSPTDIWVGGASGTIFRYNGSWSTQAAPGGITSELRNVWGKAANQVYMVGAAGNILRYDGLTWRRIANSPTGSTLNAVIGDDNGVYAVGNNGVFLQSTTAPYDNWTLANSGISVNLFGMTLGSNGNGWVVGATGYLGHYDLRP
jgi:photosystem II stability/assembly factor-like uncharacterized protein